MDVGKKRHGDPVMVVLLRQLFSRPAHMLSPICILSTDICIRSQSKPFGGGVHGASSYFAARAALRRPDRQPVIGFTDFRNRPICQATVLNFKSCNRQVPGSWHAQHARESAT